MAGKTVFRLVQMSVVLAIALALTTCGGGKKAVVQGLSPGSSQDNKTSPEGLDCRVDTAISLDQTLAELEGMECPEGVDEELWVELKDALKEALQTELTESRPGSPARLLASPEEQDGHSMLCPYKWVSIAPMGEANRVTDLAIVDNGDGTFTLSWHYRNLGDYDQNGTVGIEDITPLAQHFGEDTAPENEWIDGDLDGRVHISDITPIAINFAVEVAHYTVEGAPDEAGPFEPISEISQDAGSGEGRLEYSAVIESPAALWHRVVPYDSEGTPGEPSNAVLRPSNEPVIYEVSPTEGYQHEEYAFSAVVTGVEPLEYAWDFGGGASPDTSSESSPTVTLADAGEYAASLIVANAYGQASFPFTLTVSERDMWVHTWGGEGHEAAEDLAVDEEGNIYVLGYTESFGAGDQDSLVLKYSTEGQLLWARTWGGEYLDIPVGIGILSDGNIIVGGYTANFGAGADDIFILKYDPEGNLLMQKTWGTADYERASDMAMHSDGNIYVVGNALVFGVGNKDILVAKFSPDGSNIWARTWSYGERDIPYGVALDPAGNVYIEGNIENPDTDSRDGLLMKYDKNGSLLSVRYWDSGGHESIYSLVMTSSGRFYAGGLHRDPVTDERFPLLFELDSEGNVLFVKSTPGASFLTLGATGNLYSSGSFEDESNIRYSLLFEFDDECNLLASRLWSRGWSLFKVQAFSSTGNLYIAGSALDSSGEWQDADGTILEAEGVMGFLEGTTGIIEGIEGSPNGAETFPEGVIDVGAGGVDILLMKNFPR